MSSDIRLAQSHILSNSSSQKSIFSKVKSRIFFDYQINLSSKTQNSHDQKKWKHLILPQIHQKYLEIMKQKSGTTLQRYEPGLLSKALPLKNVQNSGHRQKCYQQKIVSLQKQNENLRQQLYYLRETLLLNFESKTGNSNVTNHTIIEQYQQQQNIINE